MSRDVDESDSLLAEALEEYLAALEHGEHLDREQFIARYPQLSASLRNALVSLEFVAQVASGGIHEATEAKSARSVDDYSQQTLGDFELKREIGRGGMAVVYEARQISLGRRVALKILPFVSVLDSRQLARFKNEAQAAALLTHQNIVPVYGVGCERGVHFFAMQYIDGPSLAEVIAQRRRQREDSTEQQPPSSNAVVGRPPELKADGSGHRAHQPLDAEAPTAARPIRDTVNRTHLSTQKPGRPSHYFRQVAEVVVQACDALDHAHEQGVIHRDIKPGNLLLETNGRLWVTDFGLARIESDAAMTMTGDILGTLRYMSPEQAMGKWPLIDHRTDIYSLGATLYELLTLSHAATGDDRSEIIQSIANSEVRPPRRLDENIPADLETITLTALAKHPSERYPTAKQFGEDLRNFLNDKPIVAKRPDWATRLFKWSRRHRSLVTATALFTVVLTLIVMAALIYSNYWIRQERERAIQADKEKGSQLLDSLLRQSSAMRRTRFAGRSEQAMASVRRAVTLAESSTPTQRQMLDLRDEIIDISTTFDLRQTDFWETPPQGWLRLCAFDSSFSRFAYGNQNGELVIHNTQQSNRNPCHLSLPKQSLRVWTSRFSPSDRYLAVIDDQLICRLWDLKTSNMIWEAPVGRGCLDFSADNRWLALGDPKGTVELFDLDAKQVSHQISTSGVLQTIRFQPKSDAIAICPYGAQKVEVRNIHDGSVLRAFSDHQAMVGDVAWSADGRRLAVGCLDGRIYVWDAISGSILAMMNHQREVVRLQFNPRGNLLASTGHDGLTRLWDSDEGRLLVTAPGHFIRFSSKGDQLAFQNRSGVGVWHVGNDSILRTLTDHDTAPGPCIRFSPDGRWLATAEFDGVQLTSVSDPAQVARLPLGENRGVAFDPRGSDLFTAGQLGVFRWPLIGDDAKHSLQIGPPERLVPQRPIVAMYMHPFPPMATICMPC